ncbi:specifically androgen-regulated gene protein [Takifugu rubripes]|nr:specifically androgen-regulated gene protein-like [Takifugu rubripes]
MAKSDTWPGGVAMESLSNMDSAESCDSVISLNSGSSQSEDSMEHLSAEERACLMYLEETIEALEVQEDSGLSNDEPESLSQAGKIDETRVRGNVSAKPREHQEETLERHTEDEASTPTSAEDVSDDNTSPNLQAQPAAVASAVREVGPSPHQTRMLSLSKDESGRLKIVSTGGQQAQTSEMDLSLIPPPSDFMDEPGASSEPNKPIDAPPSAGISNNKLAVLELLRQRASTKVTQESQKQPPEQSSLSGSTSPLLSPSPEAPEPKSPPAVAPKPKKLPANIILKSHKAAPAPETISGHSAPSGSERLLMDPQKVRMEALRKLGLLKGDEVDTGPILSPKQSPKTRRSWAAPSSPVSPASHTPPTTPSHTRSPSYVALQSPGPVSPLVLSKPPAVKSLHIVPAPAAFRDPDGPNNEGSPLKDASVYSPPNDGCAPNPEPSGQGASEESGKEPSAACGASSMGGHTASKETDSRRPPPACQPSGDSQKLPRSQGISVLICPRSENEDERRGALKRLGLLRD